MFSGIAKWFRSMVSPRAEPDTKIDEFSLEHLMFYHGLVGSSAENQRKYRDIRADIREAVTRKSSRDLAIALKVPPLFWEDKLKKIFSELNASDLSESKALLFPSDENDSLPASAVPLRNEDWRVRANAAMLLAHFQIKEADTKLGKVLDDAASSESPAFGYVAYA